MGHNPVNHPLRPVYRALGTVTGFFFVVFGVVGIMGTVDDGLFSRDAGRVLGMGSNLAWSIASIVIGAVVLLGVVIGRNLDVAIDKYLGWALLVIGTFFLTVQRTEVNILNFSISTVVVSYLAGLVLIMASYYSNIAPPEQTSAPRQERQRQAA